MLFLIKILPKLHATTNFIDRGNIAVAVCSRILPQPKLNPVTNISLFSKEVESWSHNFPCTPLQFANGKFGLGKSTLLVKSRWC